MHYLFCVFHLTTKFPQNTTLRLKLNKSHKPWDVIVNCWLRKKELMGIEEIIRLQYQWCWMWTFQVSSDFKISKDHIATPESLMFLSFLESRKQLKPLLDGMLSGKKRLWIYRMILVKFGGTLTRFRLVNTVSFYQ